MPYIVGIKFKGSGKVYYFSPENTEFKENDGAIVETVKGVEFGTVAIPNKLVPDEEIKVPLKPVIRKATDKDFAQLEINENKKDAALKVAIEKAAAHKLNMKMVAAEYTFDLKKVIFYFTADNRLDFRELVKDLASYFKIRIELRQIYERDDIKMRGALGCCGRPCCCAEFLPDFERVSLKMAKIQDLSLNPTKISGVCGKLMCCLKYENDYYNEEISKLPALHSTVTTPDGEGTVISIDVLKATCKVKVVQDDIASINTYNSL
jgi:cell fate regulator YaaT (PSP1 superfamily)